MEKCDRPGCPNERDPNFPSYGWRTLEYDSEIALLDSDSGLDSVPGDYLFCSWECVSAFAATRAALVREARLDEANPVVVVQIDEARESEQVEVFIEDQKSGRRIMDVPNVQNLRPQTLADPTAEPENILMVNLGVAPGLDSPPVRLFTPMENGSNTEGGLASWWCLASPFVIRGGQLYPEQNRRGMEWN